MQALPSSTSGTYTLGSRGGRKKKSAEGAAKRVFVVSEWVLKSVPRCLKSVIIITGVPANWVGHEFKKVHAHLVAAAPVSHPCMHSSMGTDGGNPAVQTNYTPVTVNHTAMHGDLIAGRGRTSTGSFPTKNAHCLRPVRHRGGTKEGLYLYSLKSIVSLFLTPKGLRNLRGATAGKSNDSLSVWTPGGNWWKLERGGGGAGEAWNFTVKRRTTGLAMQQKPKWD